MLSTTRQENKKYEGFSYDKLYLRIGTMYNQWYYLIIVGIAKQKHLNIERYLFYL